MGPLNHRLPWQTQPTVSSPLRLHSYTADHLQASASASASPEPGEVMSDAQTDTGSEETIYIELSDEENFVSDDIEVDVKPKRSEVRLIEDKQPEQSLGDNGFPEPALGNPSLMSPMLLHVLINPIQKRLTALRRPRPVAEQSKPESIAVQSIPSTNSESKKSHEGKVVLKIGQQRRKLAAARHAAGAASHCDSESPGSQEEAAASPREQCSGEGTLSRDGSKKRRRDSQGGQNRYGRHATTEENLDGDDDDCDVPRASIEQMACRTILPARSIRGRDEKE